MKTVILSAALLAGLALAPAVRAAEVSTAVKVSYRDLDPSQPRGAVILLDRLKSATLEACGASSFSLREYQDAVQRSACYRTGLSQAVDEVNLPALSAVYAQGAMKVAAN